MPRFRTLDALEARGLRVLLRADLNVPMQDGRVSDLTRLERLCPTIRELAAKGAKVIVLSHFDRPKGRRVPSMSLRPVAEALGSVLGRPVAFAEDCIGETAARAVGAMSDGDVLVLENTRFHVGEEANDPAFADSIAALGDVYVNDAFSAAHRAHATTEALAHRLPAYAGRLMQAELEALEKALGNPERPVAAIVGGAKVSTKLDLLGNLIGRVDLLIIVGAMANTFLAARGVNVGRSLQEPDLHDTARGIEAKAGSCQILLPMDAVVARELRPGVTTETVPLGVVPEESMILDVGPLTTAAILDRLADCRTLVWNGPLGAFEIPPFDAATVRVAKGVGGLTRAGSLLSVAGGGDTVAALRHAGVLEQLSYVSTAGGAFLEWLEGKVLPGVAALSV